MLNQKICFCKLNEKAILPSKREEDGAFDIYPCFDEDYRVLAPHETQLIPTGLASAFSKAYVAILKERGSNGSKGIGQRAGVIDSGYRGEWFVAVTNHNDKPLVIAKEHALKEDFGEALIYPYEKAICQCILVEVPTLSVEEVDYETLMSFQSERGEGRLGSSGK